MKTVGGIYRIRTVLVNPPKEKIALYVGDDRFFWFNTEARKRPGQMEVAFGECPGITRKCYLDCGRVVVFSDPEVKAGTSYGQAPLEFIRRVVEEVEERATVLVTLHRREVAEKLRQCFPDLIKTEDSDDE